MPSTCIYFVIIARNLMHHRPAERMCMLSLDAGRGPHFTRPEERPAQHECYPACVSEESYSYWQAPRRSRPWRCQVCLIYVIQSTIKTLLLRCMICFLFALKSQDHPRRLWKVVPHRRTRLVPEERLSKDRCPGALFSRLFDLIALKTLFSSLCLLDHHPCA